jgi:DNA polymerase III alpha subunit (gram-positive type)
MKDNKKERRVDNLDIKAFVKKVFQESSWLMAKLAASPEDEGECFVDMARSISVKRLNELYGDLVDDRIVERLNNEIDEFNRIGQIENILKLSDMLHRKMNKGTLIIPRLTVGNSLLLFLLEITNVNPLPRHHYCPKCHTFHWGHKQSNYCECCGELVVEDGYDLDYQLLIDDIKRLKHPFQFSTSGKKLEEEGFFKLLESKELKLAKLLGFKQNDFEQPPVDISEIFKCFDKNYYSSHYKKKHIADHQAFIGLGELGNVKIQEQVCKENVKTFDDLVRVVTMMHGTGVRENSKRLNVQIYSRDDLFKFLKKNQLTDDDALIICRETRLSGEGHLSALSEEKLKEAGVNENSVDFMRSIHYIFVKAHAIANLKMLLKLAKTYLEEPKRFYEAYFTLDKEAALRSANTDDLIRKLVEAKSTKDEELYYSLIDYQER